MLEDNTASASYRQPPRSSASSASAPHRWPQNTLPPSHSLPASSSSSSSNRPSPCPPSAPMLPGKKSLCPHYYLPLRPRGHCCRCWRGTHVGEPLVNQLVLNGKHLTVASDQRAPEADKQVSALHEPAGGREVDVEIFNLCFFLSFPRLFVCVCVCALYEVWCPYCDRRAHSIATDLRVSARILDRKRSLGLQNKDDYLQVHLTRCGESCASLSKLPEARVFHFLSHGV